MKRNLIAVSYHRLFLPITRYRSSHDVIVPSSVSAAMVSIYGLAILHKAPKIYGKRLRTNEKLALQLGEGFSLNIKLDDRSRFSPHSRHIFGPTSCLLRLRSGVKSSPEVS